jgi:polysaccharide deacetylase family protein (PEP-CTERM system associated)
MEVVNAFSVDVEDYFQVRSFESIIPYSSWDSYQLRVGDNTRRLLSLAERHGVKGTFFVLGWNAQKDPGLVREISRAGHEVASHGWSHKPIHRMGPAEFRAEVTKAKAFLEDITGSKVLGFRAPSYSIVASTLWALEVLVDTGHEYDSSIYPIRRRAYGIPTEPVTPHARETARGRIAEFPMSTLRLAGQNLPFGSGAYLRLLPCELTALLVRRLNARAIPAVVSVHPWELDPEQPRVTSWVARPNHYAFLRRTEARLDTLLGRFRFEPLSEVLRRAGLVA